MGKRYESEKIQGYRNTQKIEFFFFIMKIKTWEEDVILAVFSYDGKKGLFLDMYDYILEMNFLKRTFPMKN